MTDTSIHVVQSENPLTVFLPDKRSLDNFCSDKDDEISKYVHSNIVYTPTCVTCNGAHASRPSAKHTRNDNGSSRMVTHYQTQTEFMCPFEGAADKASPLSRTCLATHRPHTEPS